MPNELVSWSGRSRVKAKTRQSRWVGRTRPPAETPCRAPPAFTGVRQPGGLTRIRPDPRCLGRAQLATGVPASAAARTQRTPELEWLP
jgi:hypothetical protein